MSIFPSFFPSPSYTFYAGLINRFLTHQLETRSYLPARSFWNSVRLYCSPELASHSHAARVGGLSEHVFPFFFLWPLHSVSGMNMDESHKRDHLCTPRSAALKNASVKLGIGQQVLSMPSLASLVSIPEPNVAKSLGQPRELRLPPARSLLQPPRRSYVRDGLCRPSAWFDLTSPTPGCLLVTPFKDLSNP